MAFGISMKLTEWYKKSNFLYFITLLRIHWSSLLAMFHRLFHSQKYHHHDYITILLVLSINVYPYCTRTERLMHDGFYFVRNSIVEIALPWLLPHPDKRCADSWRLYNPCPSKLLTIFPLNFHHACSIICPSISSPVCKFVKWERSRMKFIIFMDSDKSLYVYVYKYKDAESQIEQL